jgi:lysophospholipase L1-like esterase
MDETIAASLRAGALPVLLTVPPQRAGGRRDRGKYNAGIDVLNARVKEIAMRRGVRLVDAHALIAEDMARFVSDDDVHLTEQGNRWLWRHVRAEVMR